MYSKIVQYRGILLVCFIIGAGAFLRVWRLAELFHFTYDEEIIAFVGKRMFVNGHIPFIGGVTPMHVHVTPYFYWLSGIFLFFSHLYPLGWGIAAAGVAILTMLILFKTGKDFFSTKVALIAVFLYSFSAYQNIIDRHYWGIMFDGLLTLVTFYSLVQILNHRYKYSYILVFALLFGISVDPSTLTLIILTVFTFVLYRPHIPRNILIKSLIIIVFSMLPLIVFDLRHDFSNSRGIFQYINEIREERKGNLDRSFTQVLTFVPSTLARYLYLPGKVDLAVQYSYCPTYAISRTESVPWWSIIVVLAICGFAWNFKKNNSLEKQGISLIFIFLFSVYIGVFIYGVLFKGDLFDHYLTTLPPLFYLLTGFVVAKISKKFMPFIWIIGIIFVFINTKQVYSATHSYGYADKAKAVQWAIATTGNEPFSLDVLGSCFRYNGYRYLFYVYGKEPAKSYVDANFTHLFDQPPAQTHPAKLVVITNPDIVEADEYYREYLSLKEKLISSAKFGKIEVLLIDNSNLDFVGKF